MKTIAKAITRHSARDAYGKTYYSETKLIRGECYIVDKGVLKTMLLPQEIVEKSKKTLDNLFYCH